MPWSIDDQVEDHLAFERWKWFKEFRDDGWPLCPRCNNDELYCPGLVAFYNVNQRNPTIDECIEIGLCCYWCGIEFPSRRSEMKSYPQNNDHQPGTWKALQTPDGQKATFTCPDCKLVGTLIDHEITDDGTVTPSVVCDCGYHEFVKLENWNG